MSERTIELTKSELVSAARGFIGGDVTNLSTAELLRQITIAQHITDVLLNEIEARGELTLIDGVPCLPYESDYVVETILTRPLP
jgi:hypothetical protein